MRISCRGISPRTRRRRHPRAGSYGVDHSVLYLTPSLSQVVKSGLQCASPHISMPDSCQTNANNGSLAQQGGAHASRSHDRSQCMGVTNQNVLICTASLALIRLKGMRETLQGPMIVVPPTFSISIGAMRACWIDGRPRSDGAAELLAGYQSRDVCCSPQARSDK